MYPDGGIIDSRLLALSIEIVVRKIILIIRVCKKC
jgi:hypothetical protein